MGQGSFLKAHGLHVRGDGKEEKVFFFEKKNKKTCDHGARCRRAPYQQLKVFCFFSSEKKTFLLWTTLPLCDP
jgi:hypothetical protein